MCSKCPKTCDKTPTSSNTSRDQTFQCTKRNIQPRFNETYLIPDAVPPHFEPMTEDYTPPRRGRIRKVKPNEYPNVDYDDGEQTYAQDQSTYDDSTYTYNTDDETTVETVDFLHRRQFTPDSQAVSGRTPDLQRMRFDILRNLRFAPENTYDDLNIQPAGQNIHYLAGPQAGSSGQVMTQTSRTSPKTQATRTFPNIDVHISDTSLVTESTFYDKHVEYTRTTDQRGQTGQLTKTKTVESASYPSSQTPIKKRFSSSPCKRTGLSAIKIFDQAVTSELKKKLKENSFTCPNKIIEEPCPPMTSGRRSIPAKSSLSTVEFARTLDPDYRTNALVEAVEKLAQAEAACRFDGAVRAAEAAAAAFPEGILAEEAAVAGVRGYQAELVDSVHQMLEVETGFKPIEVVGYIGVTRPTN